LSVASPPYFWSLRNRTGVWDHTSFRTDPLRFLQRIMIRASIDILPRNVRELLELGRERDLGGRERRLLQWLGRRAERFPVPWKSVHRGLSMGQSPG